MLLTNITIEELKALAKRMLDVEHEQESCRLYEEFNSHFSHPDTANLFYWPEDYNARNIDISEYNPSIEEVIQIGIKHKPIQLPT